MKPIQQIQNEVVRWSLRNFGHNEVRLPLPHPHREDTAVCLHQLCSIMGIVEELGELCEDNTDDELEDAIGDTGIYLMDYASRCGVNLDSRYCGWRPDHYKDEPLTGFLKWLGKAMRCELKRLQGIRGMDDDGEYWKQREEAIHQMHGHLAYMSMEMTERPFLEIINEIWNKVSQRDWKENPKDGSESTESKGV